jgi:O-antigen ligase
MRRLILLAGVAVAFVAILNTHNPTYSQSAFDRLSRFGNGSPGDPNKTLDSRIQGYRVALARIRDDPFVGVGLDSESNRAGTLPVHDIVLGTWFATGFLGLAGIFIIWLGVARAALSTVLGAQDADERALALALAASSIAFLVFLLSEPALFSRFGWASAALILALRAIQIRRRREEAVVRLPLVAVPSR